MKTLIPLAFGVCLTAISVSSLAQTSDSASRSQPSGETATSPPSDDGRMISGRGARWYLQTSLLTRHFHPDPEHVNTQRLINLEWINADDFLVGAASFRNSFGQPSQLFYVGKRWHPLERFPNAHVKLVAGILHGYKDPYKDKIPFNTRGVAPAVLPAIGWSTGRFATEVVLFGNSGLLWTAGVYLD